MLRVVLVLALCCAAFAAECAADGAKCKNSGECAGNKHTCVRAAATDAEGTCVEMYTADADADCWGAPSVCSRGLTCAKGKCMKRLGSGDTNCMMAGRSICKDGMVCRIKSLPDNCKTASGCSSWRPVSFSRTSASCFPSVGCLLGGTDVFPTQEACQDTCFADTVCEDVFSGASGDWAVQADVCPVGEFISGVSGNDYSAAKCKAPATDNAGECNNANLMQMSCDKCTLYDACEGKYKALIKANDGTDSRKQNHCSYRYQNCIAGEQGVEHDFGWSMTGIEIAFIVLTCFFFLTTVILLVVAMMGKKGGGGGGSGATATGVMPAE